MQTKLLSTSAQTNSYRSQQDVLVKTSDKYLEVKLSKRLNLHFAPTGCNSRFWLGSGSVTAVKACIFLPQLQSSDMPLPKTKSIKL